MIVIQDGVNGVHKLKFYNDVRRRQDPDQVTIILEIDDYEGGSCWRRAGL